MWIVIASGLVVVVLWFFRSFHRDEELGAVSAQWLAEYRQNNES